MKPGSARWWRELGLEAPAAPGFTPAAAEALPPPGFTPAAAEALPPRDAPASGGVPVDAARQAGIAALPWEALPVAIEDCQACALRQGRRRSVPGIGGPGARWMFVGEGPGAEEDLRGEPFVGAAGQLLDSMLAALGLQRGSDACIANVVKCRPPANRTPEPAECAACLPFLERQIALVQPRILVALGRVAAQTLLGSTVNVGSLRGRVHDYQGIPLVVTYHPAYLLRNQAEKARAWVDLCLAQRALAAAGAVSGQA
ncbi:MAG: uracil-DNA glycosylase [Pseudomonadota bacterium]|nr:uracil-DNA glycosylase [Pseudomonadota bacterium]